MLQLVVFIRNEVNDVIGWVEACNTIVYYVLE